jgi:hypothetical protein
MMCPNGGFICCDYCAYSRFFGDRCDIHGIKTSPHIICRSFRMPEQSHSEARERCPVLENLEPGVVFSVENAVYADFDPKPLYRMGKI